MSPKIYSRVSILRKYWNSGKRSFYILLGKDTDLLANIPWSRHQILPNSGEQISIERTFPDTELIASGCHAVVKKTGLRTVVAEHTPSCETSDSELPLPRLNSSVVATFFRDDVLYSFESVVQRYIPRTNGTTTIVLRRPKRVVKVQRRFSYRIPVETRTCYRLRNPLGLMGEVHGAKIVNISEGGMLIETAGELPENALVTIDVPSGNDGEAMSVVAEVLEVREVLTLNQHKKIGRLRFDGGDRVQLTKDERDLLVRYIFEQQRMMLQTRRLLNTVKKTL
jgi:c-di-GMP-binding flagellar brake protein YcgR